MWKPMLAGTVALVLSGTSLVLAQQPPAPATPQTTPAPPASAAPATPSEASPSTPKATPQKPAASKESAAEDRAAIRRREAQSEARAELEGRIASLKVRLMLTKDQAKYWPAFEKAYRDFAILRMEQWSKFRDRERSDNPIENMEARADFIIRRGTAMKEFATAAMPLYDSLEPNQQRRLGRSALRGLMMMGYRCHGSNWRDDDGTRWGDRDGGGPRWRDRDYGEQGYGPRWGGRGNDGGGYYRDRPGWNRRGEGMMGPRDRDDDDRRAGPMDDDDTGNDNGRTSGGSRRLGPDEEQF